MRKLMILIFEMMFVISAISQNYVPGTILLRDDARGGEVSWGQSENNDGSCSPSYNLSCPLNPGAVTCGWRAYVGCGAVAMGQIMWKWKFPQSSSYRTYDWNVMPTELKKNTPKLPVYQVADLLSDCGIAAKMNYNQSGGLLNVIVGEKIIDPGSWTTIDNIVEGLKAFNYKSTKYHLKENWNYGNAWEDLIRSEIKAKRPIIY